MNPETIQDATKLRTHYRRLASKYPNLDLSYAPPTAYLSALAPKRDESIGMVAQNIFYEESGAYTGATSVGMVGSVGATAVLIGHSERRTIFGVDEDVIGKKVRAAIEAEMPMIVCIGEQDRDDRGVYIDELEKQLDTILAPFAESAASKAKLKLLTIAYEPLWAVGAKSRRAVTCDELFSTCLLIEKNISKYMSKARAKKIPVLYGGSVNADNVVELAAVQGINGVLVGRASRDPQELEAICQAVTTS
jgi:triosephosphate isomerase